MEFPYTPHISSILKGRSMFVNGKLMCCATHCLFETSIKNFGREIEVKGIAECPNCKSKIEYPQDLEFNEQRQQSFLKCFICKKILSMSIVTWTQIVVSKHYKTKHLYFHKECHENRYIDIPVDEDDGEDEDNE